MMAYWYLLPLLAIVYEDFRFQAIHWFWLALFTVLAVMSIPFRGDFFLVNIGFISFQLLSLTIYFSVKEKRLTNIINRYLGIGDILFFIPVCFLFSPVNLIFFFVTSMLFSLIIAGLSRISNPNSSLHIPLAGLMSIALIFVLLVTWYAKIDLHNDQLLLHYLSF